MFALNFRQAEVQDTCNHRHVTLLALLLVLAAVVRGTATAGQGGAAIVLAGHVVDADGKPVAGATVELQGQAAGKVQVKTDGSGAFALKAPRQSRYELAADTADKRHGELAATGPGAELRVVVKPPVAPQTLEFADKPDFTVAGITDWTAVGGHGSDATLRTSEDLAHRTAELEVADGDVVPGLNVKREAALRNAVLAHPDSYEANRALGELYLSGHMDREASGYLERAAALHGHTAEDEYRAAQACEGEGDYARARRHVAFALAANNARAGYQSLAGELDELLGSPLDAVREDERAAELAPTEQNYLVWGSELLLHRAIVQAAQVFARGVALYPQSQRLRLGWGAALFAEARYDEAARELCHASDLEPKTREPYIFLGKLELASSAPAPCVQEELARFQRQSPGDGAANFYEAMMLLKTGDRSKAVSLLGRVPPLDSQYAEAQLQLGILAAEERDTAAAEASFRRAIADAPKLAEAHYRLGVLLDRSGHPEQAKAEFTRHEALVKEQAERVEQERRQVKQFLVVLGADAPDTARP